MSEQKLIQAILNGDSSKFELLVLKYQTMVFHTAMGFVHNREDAEDLTQDIFIHTFESLSSFKGNSEFSTWLYRISVNTSINQLKKRKRSQLFHFAEDLLQSIFNKESNDPDPEQHLIDIERNVAIRKAIDSLPEKQRTAFVLSKYDDLSQKEIAAIMHCSEGSVEQLLQRTKITLQRKLSIKVGNK